MLNLGMIASMYIVLLLFYIPLIFFIQKRKKAKIGLKYFFNGVASILNANTDDEKTLSQINLLYKKIMDHYSVLSTTYRTPIDLLEELIVYFDTLSDKEFLSKCGLEKSIFQRQSIIDMHYCMKIEYPYSGISSKEANLLMILSESIQTKNEELGKNTISQVADEFEMLENNLRKQSKINSASFIVSVVSTILTIIFGIISLIQFIYS